MNQADDPEVSKTDGCADCTSTRACMWGGFPADCPLHGLKTDGCSICGAKYVGPGHKCQDPLADKCEIQKDKHMQVVISHESWIEQQIEQMSKELQALTQSDIARMVIRADVASDVGSQTVCHVIHLATKILESVL